MDAEPDTDWATPETVSLLKTELKTLAKAILLLKESDQVQLKAAREKLEEARSTHQIGDHAYVMEPLLEAVGSILLHLEGSGRVRPATEEIAR